MSIFAGDNQWRRRR